MDKEDLDNFVICKKCHTLHRKIELQNGAKALCRECNSIIYRHYNNIVDINLALSWITFISLIIAFTFSILSININGINQSLNFYSMFMVIFEKGYYLVGIMLSFLILIFPIFILSSTILFLTLMKLKKCGYLVKRLLILVAKLLPWSMVDIFFISLLVAMVKLFSYAQIELCIGFWAFIIVLFLDIITLKRMSFDELWKKFEDIYVKEYK